MSDSNLVHIKRLSDGALFAYEKTGHYAGFGAEFVDPIRMTRGVAAALLGLGAAWYELEAAR